MTYSINDSRKVFAVGSAHFFCHRFSTSQGRAHTGKGIAEHRAAALGLFSCRFALDYVPMLDQLAISNAHDIRRDPVRRLADAGKPSVYDDKVALGKNSPRFISQSRRDAPDQIKQTIATRCDVSM